MNKRVTVRFLSIATLLLTLQSAAQAAPGVKVVGSLSLPYSCSIKSSAGGCDSPTPGLYISSGAEFLQPCLLTSAEPLVATLCAINDHDGGAGHGAAVVHDADGCAGATIELASDEPGDVYLDLIGLDETSEPSSQWRVVSLALSIANGSPAGLGYRWSIEAGSIDAANLADGALLHLSITEGEMRANVRCGVGGVSQFSLAMTVHR